MAFTMSQHAVLTLSGAAEPLPALASGVGVRWMALQPGAANANPIYIGGAGVSAASYGTRLPASAAGVPSAPHIIAEFVDGSLRPSALYVIGTAGEKLHIHVIAFEPTIRNLN